MSLICHFYSKASVFRFLSLTIFWRTSNSFRVRFTIVDKNRKLEQLHYISPFYTKKTASVLHGACVVHGLLAKLLSGQQQRHWCDW